MLVNLTLHTGAPGHYILKKYLLPGAILQHHSGEPLTILRLMEADEKLGMDGRPIMVGLDGDVRQGEVLMLDTKTALRVSEIITAD